MISAGLITTVQMILRMFTRSIRWFSRANDNIQLRLNLVRINKSKYLILSRQSEQLKYLASKLKEKQPSQTENKLMYFPFST